MTSLCPVLARYRLVRSGPCVCLSSMCVQNLLAAHAFAVVGLHSLLSVFDYFLVFPFLYGLPYLGARPCLAMGFAFLQPTLFPAILSCHTTLSFLLRSCFISIYSSPNCPVRPLVLLLYHWWAPVSHLFSLRRPELVCFPWASSDLFLILHSHGLLLNSLGFPGPFTLSLILGVHRFAINPLPSLLSLLWACRDPFSLFHIIYCSWFAFSLFPCSFKPIYLLKTHLFISWACDPLFLLLGFNEIFIRLPTLFCPCC